MRLFFLSLKRRCRAPFLGSPFLVREGGQGVRFFASLQNDTKTQKHRQRIRNADSRGDVRKPADNGGRSGPLGQGVTPCHKSSGVNCSALSASHLQAILPQDDPAPFPEHNVSRRIYPRERFRFSEYRAFPHDHPDYRTRPRPGNNWQLSE